MTEDITAKTEMLIRKPPAEVFQAFIDPAITSRFWFTRGSGLLEVGKRVRWHWDMYNFFITVDVKAIEHPRRITIEWAAEGKPPTTIDWTFDARPDGTTFVHSEERGFRGSRDEVVQAALNSMQGFTFVLAGLKAWLEHGVELQLVRDRHPDGLPRPLQKSA